jgi:arylsulfatase A-like enzyme
MFGPDGPISRDERRTLEYFENVNQGRRTLSRAQREHLVRLYDGNLAFADRELGRLRSTMERLSLWDRTVVLVTADHGEALDEHGHVGHIRQLYEESVWIPLIVRFPRGAHLQAKRVDGMVSLIDLAPTIADLLGLLDQQRARQQFQGRSLLPMIFGSEARPMVLSSSSYDRPRYSLRDSSFKYIVDTANGAEELYDLRADAGERHDLAASDALRTAYYRQRLFQDLLEQRRGAASGASEAELTPEQIDNLKALGYLQ